jgi:fused signal recognition particle receptor
MLLRRWKKNQSSTDSAHESSSQENPPKNSSSQENQTLETPAQEIPVTEPSDLGKKISWKNSALSSMFKSAFGKTDEVAFSDIEEALLMADVGVDATTQILDRVRKTAGRAANSDSLQNAVRNVLLEILAELPDRSLGMNEDGQSVIVIVGVNGTGKTTTVGKMAFQFNQLGKKVVVGAADTFRAAAADQLETWALKSNATIVRGVENGDPASVAFETVAKGVELGADVIIVDTAGRLQNKSTLMEELSKVIRVIERKAPVTETLLVLDATTGQNGLNQAEVFGQSVNLTGIVLTKFDGTAKGGIVFAVQQRLGVPVKLVGIGENADDLISFNAMEFVDSLLS